VDNSEFSAELKNPARDSRLRSEGRRSRYGLMQAGRDVWSISEKPPSPEKARLRRLVRVSKPAGNLL
jgi:hypothetical protein